MEEIGVFSGFKSFRTTFQRHLSVSYYNGFQGCKRVVKNRSSTWSDFRLFGSGNRLWTSPIALKVSEMDSTQNFSWKTCPGGHPTSPAARKPKKTMIFHDFLAKSAQQFT